MLLCLLLPPGSPQLSEETGFSKQKIEINHKARLCCPKKVPKSGASSAPENYPDRSQ
jgi:hypothetical protein